MPPCARLPEKTEAKPEPDSMRRELEHFTIGDSYGGNQDWFLTRMMRLGGCGAETACDSSIYFAREFGLTKLYPFDPFDIKKEEYVEFAHRMEKYLWPRMTGIDRPEIFAEWFGKYAADCGESRLSVTVFRGSEPYGSAEEFLRTQIDAGYPVPVLILNHKSAALKDYVWHWFLVNGYGTADGETEVKAVTYGEYEWLSMRELWETGHERRGGMIGFRVSPSGEVRI